MSGGEKRNNSELDSSATPVKRVKTSDEGTASALISAPAVASTSAAVSVDQSIPSSSPAPDRDGDSPSSRGQRGGGRGKGGGRGRGRGGDRGGYDGRGRFGRGRGDGRRDPKMRVWGPKEVKEEGDSEPAEEEEKKDRLPKKKVAVLFGYNGIGYNGSQINPGVATIEGEVFKALVEAGMISEDNAKNHQKVSLSRAARTDAGVHAAVNVLSLKLILNPPSLPPNTSIEAHINSFLPPTLRIWSLLRVQGGFNPRSHCDQRHYEYTLPTHSFLGPKPGSPMAVWLEKSKATTAKPSTTGAEDTPSESATTPRATAEPTPFETAAEASTAESDKFWSSIPAESAFMEDLAAKRNWRISEGLLKSARDFVSAFDGSHNFYNYTVGKDFRDRTCQRVMRKLEISDPFVVNDVEYVAVSFLGQSFMLHQIRKMIGLSILAIRSSTPPSLVPETFGPSRIHVPKAPGLGLCLLEPQYLEYNKNVAESNAKFVNLNAAGRIDDTDLVNSTRDPVEIGNLKEAVDTFKKEQIYTKMWELEEKNAVFSKWLNYLDHYSGPDFEYLNPKGVIPQSAVFKKGENAEKIRRAADAAAPTEEVAPPSDDEDVAGEEEG